MGTKSSRLLVLIVCLGCSATASAFYVETRGTDGEVVRWPAGAVEYRMNTSTFPEGDGIEEAVRAAFATWSDADCATITFTEGDAAATTANDHWTGDDGARYVLVYFTDSDAEWTGGPAVGHFFYGHEVATGGLLGATVVLNSRDHAWSTDGGSGALDVQSVVTALIGRSMGITSAMEGNATYPSYSRGDTSKRTLGSDDLAAVQYLYPDGACAAPSEPEAVCDGITGLGEEPCPPRPTTSPGDAGTTMSGDDAGSADAPDAGPSGDAGTSGGGGGCSASSGRASYGALVWITIFAMFLVRRRRA